MSSGTRSSLTIAGRTIAWDAPCGTDQPDDVTMGAMHAALDAM